VLILPWAAGRLGPYGRSRVPSKRHLAAVALVAMPMLAGASGVAAASVPTCNTAPLALVNESLGIAAGHVVATHPAQPVGALICSYYGHGTTNSATVNYIPASAKAFAAVEASLASSQPIRTIAGIKSGAYSYSVGSVRYLYVLDGSTQVQIVASFALAKLEVLARELPSLT
jgi:hypothetical protein